MRTRGEFWPRSIPIVAPCSNWDVAWGFLLAEFSKDGWDVLGIEPDKGYCQFIKKHHNLEALPTILEHSEVAAESIDVVIFLHVIEHLPDPLATLKAVHRVLKPGGHVVIETPRYDSLMFRMLRHRERSLSCDGHIYFFTTDTLRRLYQAAGFVERQLKYVGRSLSLDRLMWNVGVISKSRTVQNALATISRALNFEAANIRLNMRDMQRVLVQKPTLVKEGADTNPVS